ncbi:iron-containing alcohol dehydrogenase [Paenibacillus vini]|uniref:iron-containing alcohol dehydrogenase n=1 Tax=Paenibacillus vini TaxID=1476024 RepID=UPI0025B65A27|nr:iron-containing alcohol dehydrogenase [Paenibacillus vini]MDN4066458.1 iron-containing alcohol dehydrogenase [Paenibacillus vini]
MNGLVWPTIIEGTGILKDAINRYSDAVWCVSPSLMESFKGSDISSDQIVTAKEADLVRLNELHELISKSAPSTIVALGGGKAIDLAKLAARYETVDDPSLWGNKAGLLQYQRTRSMQLIAIPSTAGSGSETSETAVITVNGHKTPIHSDKLRPDLVLLDPNLIYNAPPRVLWNGLWDTFVHALESSLSPISNADTLAHSLEVFRNSKEMIDHSMRKSSIKEQFPASPAQWNSLRAGKAQSKASVGLAHALAHQSEHSNQWHGEACARVLVNVLAKNAEKAEAKITKLAETAGFSSIEQLMDWTGSAVGHSVGAFIPNHFSEDEKGQVLMRIMKDPCFRTNPVFWTKSELSIWLEEWFYE